MRPVLAALAAIALSWAASANDPGPGDGEAAGNYAGPYTFDCDGLAQSGCTLTLADSGSYGQFDIGVPARCRTLFPVLGEVSGWAPGERGFRLLTGMGGVAIDFADSGHGLYLGSPAGSDGSQVYRMSFQAPQEVRGIAGRYALWPEAGWEARCMLTLTLDHAGRTATYGASSEPDCGRLPVATLAGWMWGGPGVIVLTERDGAVLGRFEQMEGGEDALAGTIHGVALKLGKMVE